MLAHSEIQDRIIRAGGKVQVLSTGAITMQPAADSTTAIQFFAADGTTPVVQVDTTGHGLIVTGAAPYLQLTDTTALAKSLVVVANGNLVDLRESAGASGSLLVLDLANARVGIGTATPRAKLEIINGSAFTDSAAQGDVTIVGPNIVIGDNAGNLEIATNDAVAAGLGGSISFGARFTGTSQANFATIKSGLVGSYGGFLSFGTRPDLGNVTEAVRIDSTGNVIIGATAAGATAAGVLALGGTSVEPTTSVDLVHIYGFDRGAGARALTVFQEAAPEDTGDIAVAKLIPVRWNGVNYKLFAVAA